MSQPIPEPVPPPAPASSTRAAHGLIYFIIFLDLLGVGIIAPMTPYIVGKFDASGFAIGILTMCYSAAQFLATPVLGVLSDRFGRRPILIFSIIGSAIGYAMFATAGALWMLFVSRIIDGATGGNISTAQAYIADTTPPEKRAKAYGLVGAAFGVGFTLGPVFSSLLSYISDMAPVWGACVLSLITASLVTLKLTETVTPDKRRVEPLTPRDFNPFTTLLRVIAMAGIPTLLLAIFLLNFAHAELRTSFGIMLRDRFAFVERQTGWMFAYMGMMAVLVQGGLVRRVAPKLGDRTTAIVGLPLAALGYFLMPLGPSWQCVAGSLAIMAIGGGLAGPTLSSILSGSVDPRHQGAVMGAAQSAGALALVIGPLVAGGLYDHAGTAWPFWTAAIVDVLALLLIIFHHRPPVATDPTAAAPAVLVE